MNIALFSPSQNPYSETFIQAHKTYLKGNVFYYYGGVGRMQLEGKPLVSHAKQWQLRLFRKLKSQSFGQLNSNMVLASLKANTIDVILVEYGTYAYALLPILKTCGIPFVVHFHGYDASVKTVINQCDTYKDVFSLASKVVSVSKVMTQQLLDLGCPKDKLVYNVYGPQPEFLEVKPKFIKPQFVGIGRFVDKKAPYYTILAFAQVVKQCPEAKLLLAGKGVLLNSCLNLIKYFNLEGHIHYLGVITPDEYRLVLNESLGFIQHSITSDTGDKEGTPLAVLEASAAGLPVIATKHAGILDVIIDGETGFLVAEHDVDGMVKAMITLLNNPELAKQMGAKGRQNISEHFSLERHISSLQETLEKTVYKLNVNR